MVGFLYGLPLLGGAVSFPSGIALVGLGLGIASLAGEETWPLRGFVGTSISARLLRYLIPFFALVTIGEGALFLAFDKPPSFEPLAAILAFALLVLATLFFGIGASRRFASSIDALIVERQTVEKSLSDALRRRDSLLAELNHRTRNSLQLVLSFIDLEGIQDDSPHAEQLRTRVSILAFIHDALAKGDDPSAIGAANFVSGLAALFTGKSGIRYETSAGDFSFLFDLAAPLGIIVAEIDCRFREAAFPEVRSGTARTGTVVQASAVDCLVRLELRRSERQGYEFRYEADRSIELTSLDLSLANAIANHQLGGELTARTDAGLTLISVHLGDCAYARRI